MIKEEEEREVRKESVRRKTVENGVSNRLDVQKEKVCFFVDVHCARPVKKGCNFIIKE